MVDDSISEKLKNEKSKQENTYGSFEMKKYSSCENIDKIINKYIDLHKKNYRENYYSYNKFISSPESVDSNASKEIAGSPNLSSDNFSETNTQVSGVDESEIVKTDGKNIYYFSSKGNNDKYIYVLSLDRKKVIKKIKIPRRFFRVEFFLQDGKLIIVGNLKKGNLFGKRPFYGSALSSYVIIYDVKNLGNLKMEKFYTIDGNYSNSRLVGDKLYVISNNYFNFYGNNQIPFSVKDSIPQKLEINEKGKNNYSLDHSKASSCSDLEFILPDEKYFAKNNFSLNYSIISVIDIKNLSKNVKTKVIASYSSEIFMNEKNLYLTSNLYFYEPFSCFLNNCLVPEYDSKNNTLVNKFALNNGDIEYKKSALVEGRPLTQYSMDEDKYGNFRILTQLENWNNRDKTYTNLYILGDNLDIVSKLEEIGKGERFQGSRYIGDKLFLVTFEQIDPLFVIDLKNPKNPKVLGELKIPGYSSYLHSYDENHLIGLGVDTKKNKYGGIQTNGLKLDLYEINYNKKCSDKDLTKEEKEGCDSGKYKGIIAKQLFTKTFGGSGSNSEALGNPKMFIWNKNKEKLLLPVNLNDYGEDKDSNKMFTGMIAFDINKNSGIKEAYRVTHIDLKEVEKSREKECKQYKGESKKEKCRTLLNGEKYCNLVGYIQPPEYCFADSSIWEYINQNNWISRYNFINRALWIGDNSYALSPGSITANNLDTGEDVLKIELK